MSCAPHPGLIQLVHDLAPSLGTMAFLAYAGLTALTAAFLAPVIIGAWRGE